METATTKLRYLLPPKIVAEVLNRKKQRMEMSKDGVDSGILRDVLLVEFRDRTRSDKNAPLTEQDARVKEALETLFLETIAWELDEETAVIGTQTLDLLLEVLGYLPHAHEQSLETLKRAMAKWQQRHEQEQRANAYAKDKQTEGEKELQETMVWMSEQRKRLEAFIQDMQHDLKLAERESSDIEARAEVESEYIADCSQLTNEYEYWTMEKAEKEIEKEETRHKAVHYALPQMTENAKESFERLLRDLERREALLRERDRSSQATLNAQLAHAKLEVAKAESEIYESHIRALDMQKDIQEWRRMMAEEKAKEEQLLRLCNAAIRIQRWFRWIKWKKSKWGKKMKKGKKKGKGGGKKDKKPKSKKKR